MNNCFLYRDNNQGCHSRSHIELGRKNDRNYKSITRIGYFLISYMLNKSFGGNCRIYVCAHIDIRFTRSCLYNFLRIIHVLTYFYARMT